METITNLVAGNTELLTGVAGVVCGAALMYLVITRTLKRRADQ